MRNLRVVTSSSRVLLNLLLVLSFVSDAAGVGQVADESKKTIRQTESGSGLVIRTYNEIPEATEPCTPEESEWWKRLRQAGNEIQKKNDKKSKTSFFLLLNEGRKKAYRIPLKDRPPQRLVSVAPTYDANKYKVKGTVVASVEYRADGSVGDVQIVNGLAPVIDDSVIHACRQIIFLPAIKGGAFVTQIENYETKFWHK